MSWFNKHLNWSLFLAWLVFLIALVPTVLHVVVPTGLEFIESLGLAAFFLPLAAEFWYLKRKNRSFFFLLLYPVPVVGVLALLTLKNKTGEPENMELAAGHHPNGRMKIAALVLAIIGGVGNLIVGIMVYVPLFETSGYADTAPGYVVLDLIWALAVIAGGINGLKTPKFGGMVMLFFGLLQVAGFIAYCWFTYMPGMATEILGAWIGNLAGGGLVTAGGFIDWAEARKESTWG